MSVQTARREVIAVLTELYNLLYTSGAIETKPLLPNAATGLHSADSVATSAALDAGYSRGVVDLLPALPYLDIQEHEMFLELLPSTCPITFLGFDLDEGCFKSRREMFNDKMTSPSALKLTYNNIYGFQF